MRKTAHIPKGSYHSFCKKLYGIEDEYEQNMTVQFSSRNRNIKSVKTERTKKIDEFNDFT